MEACDQLEFDVVEVADTMGWQLPLVKRGLRQLQWSTGKGLSPTTGQNGTFSFLKTFNSALKIVFALLLFQKARQFSLRREYFCFRRRTERRPRGVLFTVLLLPFLWRPERRGAGQSLSVPPRSSAEPGEHSAVPAGGLLQGFQKVPSRAILAAFRNQHPNASPLVLRVLQRCLPERLVLRRGAG